MEPRDERPSSPSRLIEAFKALQPGVQPVGSAAAIGYSLIGSIGFLGGLGYAFDRWQGTAPTGLVVGMLLGVVVGMYLLAKELWHR
jgi:F0F1-type ATP synthase assembly protein I